MLDELLISNIGGLSSAKLKMSGRFIAITGESGSGKSSVVRAIELISGKRAQTTLIRHGEDQASTRAVFMIDNMGKMLPPDIAAEDNTLYVGRTISRNGKGRNTIQETPVSLSGLANIMEKRIRIQSQFAQLDLLSGEKQLEILDSCGGKEIRDLLSMLKHTYMEALTLDKDLKEMKTRQKRVIEQYKDAENVVNAVSKINPFPDCDKAWTQDMERLQKDINSARKLRDYLLKLRGTDLEDGILDMQQNLMSCMLDFADPAERPEWDRLLSVINENTGRFIDLAEAKSGLDALPEKENQFDEMEKKLGILRTVMRKAGVSSVDDLIRYCSAAEKELFWLSASYGKIEEKQKKSVTCRKHASEIAMDIRQKRISAAEELKTRVNWVMGELAMIGLAFDIEVKELGKLRINGADEVSFILRTPEGTSGAVNKISSGGELSRILLSIQVSLPDEQLPETIVFDEVEAGLGGRAAVLAGYKLKQLSDKCQVILVTHEASIASIADQHFVIRKDGMESKVDEISGESRVQEIARMLSGDYNLSEAREHAKSLLNSGSNTIPQTINLI